MSDPSLDRALREFHQAHLSAQAILKKLNNGNRALSLALVVVFLSFVVALYGNVTDMYAPEKFDGPLQEEAKKLLPRLEPELRLLWEETAPVYSEMAVEKLTSALPEVQAAGQKEFETLLANLKTHAEQRTNAALMRISSKQEARLRESFPDLSTEEGAEERVLEWVESFEGGFEEILAHLEIRYSQDLGELQATLDQFRSSEFEGMSEDELTRQFVHLWLTKIDRWVMLEDGGDHDS